MFSKNGITHVTAPVGEIDAWPTDEVNEEGGGKARFHRLFYQKLAVKVWPKISSPNTIRIRMANMVYGLSPENFSMVALKMM